MGTKYMQVIEMTDEEKLKMYLKEPKEKIAKMLIECNKIISRLQPRASRPSGLLRCPFCNGEPYEHLQYGAFEGCGITNIYCKNCGAQNANKESWNKRASQ